MYSKVANIQFYNAVILLEVSHKNIVTTYHKLMLKSLPKYKYNLYHIRHPIYVIIDFY